MLACIRSQKVRGLGVLGFQQPDASTSTLILILEPHLVQLFDARDESADFGPDGLIEAGEGPNDGEELNDIPEESLKIHPQVLSSLKKCAKELRLKVGYYYAGGEEVTVDIEDWPWVDRNAQIALNKIAQAMSS